MRVTIITDASWCPNLMLGSWAGYAASERGKAYHAGVLEGKIPSSASAELRAMINMVVVSQVLGLSARGDELLCQIDNLEVIQALQPRYAHHTLCRVEAEALTLLWRHVTDLNQTVRTKHIKAHSGTDTSRTYVHHRLDATARGLMREARRSRG